MADTKCISLRLAEFLLHVVRDCLSQLWFQILTISMDEGDECFRFGRTALEQCPT